MKRAVSTITVLAIALLLGFAGVLQAATYKLSHVRPQDTAVDKDLRWFGEEVEKATAGKFKVKLYPSASLGDYTVVQERVSVGAVDMACQPPATATNKQFQIVYFPYMVKDWAQAKKNYSPGTPLRNTVTELYAKEGIRVLAAWPVYFGGISLNKEAKDPGNPDVAQGLKVRVPPMKSFQMLADNTGYIGSPLPFSEAFTAIQTGVVDGAIGSGAEGYYSSFRDVTKYYIPSNTHFEVWYLIINDELLKGLDKEVQKQVEEVALRFEQRRWETAEADQAANEKKLAEFGAKIITLTPEQISKLAKKAHATVWPAIQEDVGREWAQKVQSQIVE